MVAVVALGRYWNVSWPLEICGTTLNCFACSSSPVTIREPSVTIPRSALERALASTLMLTPRSVGAVGEPLLQPRVVIAATASEVAITAKQFEWSFINAPDLLEWGEDCSTI